MLERIEQVMDAAAPLFFEGRPGGAERSELSALLDAFIPAPLKPLYRAAAPDFFAWLSEAR
jgi:hypothetical protein